jgi:cytosine/adenosine deaminase-related metal-dependent hydrolase
LAAGGARLAVGSDSHAIVDPFAEVRAVELHERLVVEARGLHSPLALLRAATNDGNACIGWPEAGRMEVGALADLVTVGLDSVRTAGATASTALATVVFAASAADIRHVVVAGRVIVEDGRHVAIDVPDVLRRAIAAVTPS